MYHFDSQHRFFCVVVFTMLLDSFLLPTITNPEVESTSSTPLTPHEYHVLVVDTNGHSYSGFRHIVAELARYGFRISYMSSGTYTNPDYLTHEKTENLSQYDVVVLLPGFSSAFAPGQMSEAEVEHFTKNYSGVLVSIGMSMMINETSGYNWPWTGSPRDMIEDRLGIDFTGIVPYSDSYYCSRNGTLNLESTMISGLPTSIEYKCPRCAYTYHYRGTLTNAIQLYKFTWDSTDEIGITYYENATGAIGIFINLQWIYGHADGFGVEFDYYWWGVGCNHETYDVGLATRAEVLARILAYAFDKDFNTIIRPQPLFHARLDDCGCSGAPANPPGWTKDNYDERCLTCLQNFNRTLVELGIPYASIAGMYGSWTPWTPEGYWDDSTWQDVRAYMLARQNDGSWEHANHYDHWDGDDFIEWTVDEHKYYFGLTEGNMTQRGFEKSVLQYNPHGDWGINQPEALQDLGYYTITPCDKYFDDILGSWAATWFPKTHVKQPEGIIVHPSCNLAGRGVENFTESSKKTAWFLYAGGSYDHNLQMWVGSINDVAVWVEHYECYRTNEVGPYRLKTLVWNLTYEIPDVKFVKFSEGITYFAKQNASIQNPTQSGPIIEFDLNVDNVATVTTLGKGMVWYVVNTTAGDTIASVEIDGFPWYFFDDYTIRIPAQNSHVKVMLGTPTTPYIKESDRKITLTSYGADKLTLTVDSLFGTVSRTKVYCEHKGEPTRVYAKNGTLTSSYNASTKTLELNVLHHGPAEITVDWRMPGDVDGDGDVDLDDLNYVLIAYGAKMGDPDYDANVDIDDDGEIDLDDLYQVLWNYGT